MLAQRDHAHRLWDGTYTTIKSTTIPHHFRFQQGLRPAHAAALDGRQDLAVKLRAMALWSAPPRTSTPPSRGCWPRTKLSRRSFVFLVSVRTASRPPF